MESLPQAIKRDYEIRHLRSSDFPQLTDLFKSVLNVERDEAFWRWKYELNPAGEQLMAVAVKPETGQVVGQVGTNPTYMAFEGEKILGTQTCDIAIRAEYQKGGPFFKLHDLANEMLHERGIQLMFGFSISKTLKISTRALNFKNVFHILRLVRVLNPTPFIERKVAFSGAASVLGKISGKLLYMVKPARVRPPEGSRVLDISSFDERFDRLMETVASTNRIMVYKDAAYLNWRYFQCPLYTYRIFALEKDGGIAGFTVVSIQQENIRRAYVLELIAAPGETEVLEVLLNKAVQYCYEEKADTVTSWTQKHSPLWNIQQRHGFKVKETDHNLITRPYFLSEVKTDVTDALSWDISMGDSDYH